MKKYVPLFEEYQHMVNEGLFGGGKKYFKLVKLAVPIFGSDELKEKMRKLGGDGDWISCAIETSVPTGNTINELVKNSSDAIGQEGGCYFSLFPLVYVCQGDDIPDKISFKDLKEWQSGDGTKTKRIYTNNIQVIRFINSNKDRFHLSRDIQDSRYNARMAKMTINDVVRNVVHRGVGGEHHSIFEESEDEVKNFAKNSEKGFEMMLNDIYFLKDGSSRLERNLTFNNCIFEESLKKFLSEEGQAAMKKYSQILEKYPNFNKFCQLLKQASFN